MESGEDHHHQTEQGASPWDDLARMPDMSETAAAASRMYAFRKEVWGDGKIPLSSEQQSQTDKAILDFEDRQQRAVTRHELAVLAHSEADFYGAVRRNENGEPYNAAGKVFEKGLVKLLIQEFGYTEKKTGMFAERVRNIGTRETDIAEDILEGADVVVERLPVDITLNPDKGGTIGSVDEHGNISKGFRAMGEVNGVRILSGFRMSNGARELKTPVCVMLFQTAGKFDPTEMLEKLRSNTALFRDLADDAFSSYWDYVDAIETI